MRHVARIGTLGALASVALFAGTWAPVARAAGFGVTENNFEAGTCTVASCTYATTDELYTRAAGHPQWGITSVELNSKENILKQREPEGSLKRLRVDVPPGLAADPEALPKCSITDFNNDACPASTEVGETKLTAFVLAVDTEFTGQVYNLQPSPGLPLEFGIHVNVQPIANEHILLEGHVEWNTDYHEWFQINNISASIPILKSKLLFKGRAGEGNFLTLPSVCSSSTTSHVELESYAGEISRTETHTPVGVDGCGNVPFKPSATVSPQTSQSDTPDGATTVVRVPQNVGASEINTADIKDAHVTLPEGLTLNPAAAHGLEACSAAQIGIGTRNPVSCPAGSNVGTVALETDLPPGSLTGNVYLGSPGGGLITNPPFTIYLVAQNINLDVSVRPQGLVNPNPSTGRLEVTFADNPQLPFSELRLTLNGGVHAPLANPLVCGAATADSLFTPYTGGPAAITSTPFTTTGCPAALPFSLGQSTAHSSPNAGAYTSYTFNLARADGQQYLSGLKTILPAGLVGAIPSVTLCGEPQAQAGTCTAASQIGVATANVGAGTDPYSFAGPVYLTGPYNGAPYGLSIPINASAGPFSLGSVVTRAAISVDPHTARVIATSSLPTIVKGVPLRLKNLSVAVNRPNFLFNPTNCGPLATESTLLSTFGATQSPTQGLATPFQVGNCGALPFKPSFKTGTSAKTSKLNGASLQVDLVQVAHEANMKSVTASLPKQLPSRLTTLQKACPEATFAANPINCRALGSEVGTATVATPVLPDKLTGSAYLVSHGGAAFPDLDLVLEGDGGVRVILTGNTNIKAGVTTSTFASIPDVPVSSFVLNLPVGPHSALTAIGGLCLKPLLMPTTITAQSGAQVKQNTRISVSGCSVRILSHRVVKHKLIIKVRTVGAGLIKLNGNGLRSASKRVSKSATVTFKLPLTRGGLKALSRAHRSHRKLKISVHVAFTPKQKGQFGSAASATVTFK